MESLQLPITFKYRQPPNTDHLSYLNNNKIYEKIIYIYKR